MKSLSNWIVILGFVVLIGCDGHHHEPPVCLTEDVTNYHLVIFKGGANNFINTVTQLGGSVERVHAEIGVAKVSGLTDRSVRRLKRNRRLIAAISKDVEVDWLRERVNMQEETDNGAALRRLNHNDPSSAVFYNIIQWNMRQIQAGEAWEVEQSNEDVRVAIIDSGISPEQTDLISQYDLTSSMNFTNSNPLDLEDINGHGTHVSGIISSNNVFVAGLAPHATLVGIKVLQADGSGNFADFIAGIMHAVTVADADILNISFGSHFSSNYWLCTELNTAISALERAISYAHSQGIVVVSGAGDGDEQFMGMDLETSEKKHYPSQFEDVISVGATAAIHRDHYDSLASYSNFGMKGIDIVAPGGNDLRLDGEYLDGIMSTISPSLVNGSINRFNMSSGTGIAAAHVSALAALISAQNNESLSPEAIKQKIIDTCDDIGEPGPDPLYGYGRINAFRAVTE